MRSTASRANRNNTVARETRSAWEEVHRRGTTRRNRRIETNEVERPLENAGGADQICNRTCCDCSVRQGTARAARVVSVLAAALSKRCRSAAAYPAPQGPQ